MLKFIRTTIAGGLLFILPLVLLFILIEKAIHLLTPPVQKILPLFTGFTAWGVTSVTLACIVLLLLLCFLAGLLARTRAAAASLRTLEDRLLSNLPGYQLLKDATARFAGMDEVEGAKVGLVGEDVGFRFALILETRDDWLLVYLPDGGPAGGTAGEVRMVPAGSVRVTDIPWLPLLACLRRGGRGALELAARHMNPAEPDAQGEPRNHR
ncbi:MULTISPECIES: hypothetical protein [Pseudomonas]|uniref:hypothetical protein n=1 Tax=Pseudomonas TaxID=286 RepID=UPI0007EE3F2A|nr:MULTISPECIES: hypothetical protein [Pseudomonas]OBY49158.1 hypothetical protein A9513_034080 [Pseudomonas sp. AU12215]UCL89543.1 hypothetical protein LDJ84_12970 [Pseudomonas sp. HS-18]WEW96001.1 hypothetical protein P3T65_17320 [Pseudomonas nitroreducens]SNS63381.1 hypothetical protein SAMN05216209_1949 [Pseudomonas nitroreducens]